MSSLKTDLRVREKLNKMCELAQEVLMLTKDEDYSEEENDMLDECQNVIDTYKNIFVY